MMLEDESGRLRITGAALEDSYVTGCVLAALGTEQADGTFQVIATQYADLPRQPARWERDDTPLTKSKKPVPKREKAGKLAIVSGLEITGGADDDLTLDLLTEYLTGELGSNVDQSKSAGVERLIIAGDSLSHASPIPSREDYAIRRATRKHYGYDASAYNASPSERFDALLADILPHMPVTVIPGSSDPANVAMPQQPLHPALFPQARAYAAPPAQGSLETRDGLDCVTNPWEADIEGWRVVGTGGQNVSDLLKYVADVESIDVMDMMLRWRCIAPTAPDTLCELCEETQINTVTDSTRVLPLPRRRPADRKRLPAYLHCRQHGQVRQADDHWTRWTAGPVTRNTQVQGEQDVSAC